MARPSMADLITRLRRLIYDPPGPAQTWTDDELQDFLDARRWEVRHARLRPESTWESGTVTYTDYYADVGDWESDALLEDAGGNNLLPASSNFLVGYWTFPNQPPPVFITGKTYDLAAAAADVLEAWAARVSLEFDFSADGASFRRSQKREALLALANQYRMRMRPQVSIMVREDL
jgi:hypothetical protein